jgi:hypothetical protein
VTRGRIFLIAALVASGIGAGIFSFLSGPSALPRLADRRCRGGCQGVILRILQPPLTAAIASGAALADSWGRSYTFTRASAKACSLADGGQVQLASGQPCVDPNGLNTELSTVNLTLQSQALATAPWTASGSGGSQSAPTVANNTTDVTAPDGSSTATKITYVATTGAAQFVLVNQAITANTNATVYTMSLWARTLSGTATNYLCASDGTASQAPHTFSTMSITSTWQRFSVQYTGSGTGTVSVAIGSDTQATFCNEPTMAAQTIYVWGVQTEARYVATSYVPTTSSTVTRQGDVITSTGTIQIGATFSISLDITSTTANVPGSPLSSQTLQLYSSGSDLFGVDLIPASAQLRCHYFNGSQFIQASSVSLSNNTLYHTACSYDGTTLKICVNGTCDSSAKTFSMPGSYAINPGNDQTNAANMTNGSIANVCISTSPWVCS